MNTALVSSEATDLLSRVTGQKLSQRDLTPPVIFLAALITVMLGVILVDGTVTDEEKQRWQKTINRFIFSENVRQLGQLISKGIQQNQVYKKVNELLKLTNPLSESERLLLISLGYEMSATDGHINSRKQQYLQVIAKQLGINPQHLGVLAVGFTHQGTIEPTVLDQVHSLLDPARFQSLDTVFIKAASDMLANLPAKPKQQAKQQSLAAVSYGELKQFQEYRQKLEKESAKIINLIDECAKQHILEHTLVEETEKIFYKLRSQRFRLAIVGEFSQGKSTLLNALLGEEIQPVREIPCSGTVTVLRYGVQKRVICRYKDQREEEIPFEQYQLKAAMSEEAALGCISDELAHSDIEEIIFEHPDFELCRNGVEIVDSPGLNEHPDRTAITQQLLKDTDAAIFLMNASRPLTQGERDLIQDLKTQLNGGKKDEPANNLFVVVNFMDLLRSEKGRQQVQQRIERFLKGESPIITGENRVHFISAQATLNAIFAGTENEYLNTFRNFTKSIEKFLTLERGPLEINQFINKLNELIQASLDSLHLAEEVLDGKLKLSETEKQKIFEQIGEASGREVKIRILSDQLVSQVVEQTNQSWDAWIQELEERLVAKSEQWSSEHSPIWSRDELAKDYSRQFNKDLSLELDNWINNQLKQAILKQPLEVLGDAIQQEIQAIQSELKSLNQQINTELQSTDTFGKYEIDSDVTLNKGFWGGLGTVALGAALVPVLLLGGHIFLAMGAAGLFSGGTSFLGNAVKDEVLKLGCEQFIKSIDKIFEKIDQIIGSVFYDRVEIATGVIAKTISIYEELIEKQERAYQETLVEREAGKALIAHKCLEIEQVQKNIEAILILASS